LAAGWLSGCGGEGTSIVGGGKADTVEPPDEDGPIIEHTPISTSQPYQQAVSISARVVDEGSGVKQVEVLYRREDQAEFSSAQLSDSGDTWSGQIPATEVASGGMYYYLHAFDVEDNDSLLPPGGAADAWHFGVTAD
jgi:hypothetical protein